jgi:hypothetical protein
MEAKKTPRPLTAAELALILDISEFTIKKLARTGELPYRMMNRRMTFDLASLLEYFRGLEGGTA